MANMAGDDGVHQALRAPPAPTPHSVEEIKELCSRRRRGEEGVI